MTLEESNKIEELKNHIKSIYEKYLDDMTKLNKIEKELQEISNFIISKKDEIKLKGILKKIK